MRLLRVAIRSSRTQHGTIRGGKGLRSREPRNGGSSTLRLCLPKTSSRPASDRINNIPLDFLWWSSPRRLAL